MVTKLLTVFMLMCISSEIVSAAPDKVICYHGTWSKYRWGNGLFTVTDIDPTLCTHLIYTFVGIEPTGNIKLLDPYLDVDLGNLKKFSDLKQQNRNLKTLVAIGGWSQESENFTKVVSSSAARAVLVNDAVSLLSTYGFDGFDLDWEYPSQRGGVPADKQNFVTLIKELRQEFNKRGYLLTAAVAAAGASVDLSYDVPALSQYLDLIHVMTYDLHGPWDAATGQNAPLYPSDVDRSTGQEGLTVDASIRGWIQRGAAPEKLALGIGTYGRTFTLSNPSNTKVGAPSPYAGNAGKYTQEAGMIGYNELVELQQSESGWTTVWDDVQKTPYTYKGNQWIGYDNPRSVSIKVEYAKSLNLGGIMIWSIETDDFKGLSGTKYPILNTINQALGGTVNENLNPEPAPQPADPEPAPQPADPEPAPQPADPEPEPQPQPVDPNPEPEPPAQTGEVCTREGKVRDPLDCSAFYYCVSVNGKIISLGRQPCGSGLVYDEVTEVCNYPALVKC